MTSQNQLPNPDETTIIRRRLEQYLQALGLRHSTFESWIPPILEKVVKFPQPDRLTSAMNELELLLKAKGLNAQDQINAVITGEPTPPIKRVSMAFKKNPPLSGRTYHRDWFKSLLVRRLVLYSLTILSSVVGGYLLFEVLVTDGITKFEISMIAVYTLLFSWITLNFWTNMLGFLIGLLHGDKWRLYIPPADVEITKPIPPRIAVVMPVYNEDVARVYAGIQTMYESLNKTGKLKQFDFFILSDSTDIHILVEEKIGWAQVCRSVGGFGKIFYRHRKNRIHKKNGNLSDFCRRWGSLYTYMVPLDADSLLSGSLLDKLVKSIELRPDVGIIQTAPRGINQKSLLSRMNQFISHLYGPLSVAGMHFWQLDDASFWGHNAIVRLEPFIKYCALPHFPGRPPFGGEILSHDFVEAALMRRAGYGVWLSDEFPDSYEELPPNLLVEFERDLRWCRGNLQHLRLLGLKGISLGHRLLFLIGNMFYFSSLLWFVSLLLITAYAIFDAFETPVYFTDQPSLFPDWPARNWDASFYLAQLTAIFLFFPKFLSLLRLSVSLKKLYQFGGFLRLTVSILIETLFSILLAPVRMLFHSRFILLAFLGKKIDWKKQNRYATKVGMLESLQAHWLGILIGLIFAGVTYVVNPSLFLWLLTIVIPLLISVPFSIFLSLEGSGKRFREWKLFLSPVETDPPWECGRLNELTRLSGQDHLFSRHHHNFLGVVADPKINALFTKWLKRKIHPVHSPNQDMFKLAKEILEENPHQMKASEARRILNNPELLTLLHRLLWHTPDDQLNNAWRQAFSSLSK